METGINLFCYAKEGEIELSEQIELMKNYGFRHTFIMADSPELMDENAEKISSSGLVIDTLHAPFYKINDIWEKGDAGEIVLSRLKSSVAQCHRYGVPVLVVHLSSGLPAPLISDAGNERFSRLMEYAEKLGVKIAYENQRCLANIALAFERFSEARFCWDVGHEGCFTPGKRYMPLFGERLETVHLHDNNLVYNQDLHLLPYDGRLDYGYIAQTLANADYNGTLMIEAFRGHSELYSNMKPEEYYERAAKNINRLKDEIEKLKS